MWKVCIARRISPAHNFDAFYIITIEFLKSLARNFQTFQSGKWVGMFNNLQFSDYEVCMLNSGMMIDPIYSNIPIIYFLYSLSNMLNYAR